LRNRFQRDRTTIVFNNLFNDCQTNAVKYNDKEKGEIKIGCKEEGDIWHIYIKDNGPGIDEKYHQKIFQIFQTLSAKDERESTGIGLTIVKKVIENYGGSVTLESVPKEGTTFWITLPKALSKAA
jgi:signal transduction histidine kinase